MRWRAERKGRYFIIDHVCKVRECIDYYRDFDNAFWECGNYFETEEEALKFAEEIKELREDL